MSVQSNNSRFRFRKPKSSPAPKPPRRPRADMRGIKLKVPGNPPDVTLQPFNNLTMVHIGSNDKGVFEYTATDLIKELIAQVDPEGKQALAQDYVDIRLIRIRAWNLTGKTLNLALYDFTARQASDATSPCLTTIMDVGNPTTYPSVGYEWPTTHQQSTLNSKVSRKVLTLVSGAQAQCVLYLTLLWKFAGTPKPLSSGELLMEIAHTLDQSRKVQEETHQELKTVDGKLSITNARLRKIVSAQPSLVSKIVDGVVHLGANVVPLAADEVTLRKFDELQTAVNRLSLYTSKESLEFLEIEQGEEI